MSMSTDIIGLRNPDGPEHQRKVRAATALYEADILDLPASLKEYFGLYETGEVVSDPTAGCSIDIKVDEESSQEGCVGYTVDVRSLPPGVTHIRFTNSW